MNRPLLACLGAPLFAALACQSTPPAPVEEAPAPVVEEPVEASAADAQAQAIEAALAVEVDPGKPRDPRSKPGFYAEEVEGRLWVFRTDDMELFRFLEGGEPTKSVSWIGAGPDGITLRGPDRETLVAYLAQRRGFHVEVVDGRLWVFAEDSDDLAPFLAGHEPAKSVTMIGEGPNGETLRATDRDTLVAYLAQKPGYHALVLDGRLWVYPEGSEGLRDLLEGREPTQSITLIGAGPLQTSLRGSDKDTLVAYLAQTEGFTTELVDQGGTQILWVFRDGSPELEEYRANGEPAKSVTWIGEGPMGVTLRGPDGETLGEYRDARR